LFFQKEEKVKEKFFKQKEENQIVGIDIFDLSNKGKVDDPKQKSIELLRGNYLIKN
jgi:hypothetical protein